VLTAAGTQVRITAGSAKAGRLLWSAVETDSKHQAQALFPWARFAVRGERRPPNRAGETKGTP
jgi:hypothetical protein